MTGMDGIGDVVTGTLVARAVEPSAGEGAGHSHEGTCLNCGTALVGDYCYQCGQRAHVHRTIAAFFHDLLHGVFHFEGKIWRTLPMLVWRPGELTRRYIDGQRASFVSPIALFLFCVFLLFAVGGLTGSLGFGKAANVGVQAGRQAAVVQQRMASLKKSRDAAIAAHRPTAAIDEQIDDTQDDLDALNAVGASVHGIDAQKVPWFFRGIVEHASKNPELLVYELKNNAYKYSWALIPLSVPFVWLLFPFSRRFELYDHTVFVTYSLCFMSLLVVAAMLLGWIGVTALAGLLWLVPPVHMYRQLKGAYSLGRAGALWRTALLTMFAFITIGLFATVVAGLGTVS